MVLVTHDPGVAGHADQIVYLLDGAIQRIETVEREPVEPLYAVEEVAR